MSPWTPIAKTELLSDLQEAERQLEKEIHAFWQTIKIPLEKWEEPTYGKEGNGFWVVGIYGKNALWYNDIEEGFNISPYRQYGHLEGYYCEQDDLIFALRKLYSAVKLGNPPLIRRGPPLSL